MIKHSAWLGAALVAGALMLAACGSGTSTPSASSASTTATTAPAASASTATSVAGSNAGGDFCTQLKQTQSNFASIDPTLAQAYQSGKFASIKAVLMAFFQKGEVELARVESTMTSAPANVQAALVVVNKFYAQLVSAVDHATSLPQFAAAIVAISKTAQLKAATATLTAYGVSQCGN